MKKGFAILCTVALLVAASCSDDTADNTPNPSTETGSVTVSIPVADAFDQSAPFAVTEVSSRTGMLGDDALDKAGWAEEDKIALWATRDNGATFTLAAQQFHYYKPIQGSARFATDLAEAPAADTYTYYGAYPIPTAVNGTQVSYNLPATQDGTYNGALDIMLANPAEGSELTAETRADDASLTFAHKCHILRLQVPEGRNYWGENIAKVRIEFPTEVVGDLTFDVTNPDAIPTFANGSKVVTVNLKRPLDASTEDAADGNYVWVFLRPGASISGTVKFTLYSTQGYQSQTLSTQFSKTLSAGKITPVTMSVPQELPVTYIDFSIAANHLGEEVNTLTLTAPEGATLRNSSNSMSFKINSSNTYTAAFYNTVDGRANGDLIRKNASTVSYDSENALITQSLLINNFTLESHTAISLTVPYLFEEDFSGVTGSYHINDDNTTSRTSGGSNTASSTDYLPGWTGARWGVEAGKAVRICCRSECAARVNGVYHGRIDSPNLSLIKDDKSPKVSISFSYSFGRSSNQGNTLQPYLAAGVTNSDDRNTTSQVGSSSDILQYKIPATVYDLNDNTALNGSYENVTRTQNFTVTATNAHRIVWEVYMKNFEPGTYIKYYYSNNWAYIDNIKVSISK